ncbi:MAG: prepilin-type N-terminal cleavage/methylation domain-containing protein [Patescibacteria group bacterium]|nr:prepilin-type N-terminal cleavage/methylation domain-containing protein [Patescibacteria group bacterium]
MRGYNKSGFSLIGVIVAIFIIAIGLVGILSLSQTSLKGAYLSKMRLVASGLAQEGIEVVRYTRRSQMEWDSWYGSISSGDYLVQYDSPDLLLFSETPLKFNASSGLYQYDSGHDSPFCRKIILTKLPSDKIRIVVEVKWLVMGNWHYLTVEDKLWNWK